MQSLWVHVRLAAELGGGRMELQAPMHAPMAWIKEHVIDAAHQQQQGTTNDTAATQTQQAVAVDAPPLPSLPPPPPPPPPEPLDPSSLLVHIVAPSGERRLAGDAEALSLCARWATGAAVPAASPGARGAASAALQLHISKRVIEPPPQHPADRYLRQSADLDALAQVHLQLRGDSFVAGRHGATDGGGGGGGGDLTADFLSSSGSGQATLTAFGPASCWSVLAVPGLERTVLIRNSLTQQFLAAAPAAVTDEAAAPPAAATAATAAAASPATLAVISSVMLSPRCMWRLVSRGHEAPSDGKADGRPGESLGFFIQLASDAADLAGGAATAAAPADVPASPAAPLFLSARASPSSPSSLALECTPWLHRASAFDICPRLLCGLLRERTSHSIVVPPVSRFCMLLNRRLVCFDQHAAFNPLKPVATTTIDATIPTPTPISATAAAPIAVAAPAAPAAVPAADASPSPPGQSPLPAPLVHVHIPVRPDAAASPVSSSEPTTAAATATVAAAPASASASATPLHISVRDPVAASCDKGNGSSSIPMHLARRVYPLRLLRSLSVESGSTRTHAQGQPQGQSQGQSQRQSQTLRLSFPPLLQRGPGSVATALESDGVVGPVDLFLDVQLSCGAPQVESPCASQALTPMPTPPPPSASDAATTSVSAAPAASASSSSTAAAAASPATSPSPASPRSGSPPLDEVDPSAWRWRLALESEWRRAPAVPAAVCVTLESLMLESPAGAAAAAGAVTAAPAAAAAGDAPDDTTSASLAELRDARASLSSLVASLHTRALRAESRLQLLSSEWVSASPAPDGVDMRLFSSGGGGGLSPAHCRALSTIERSFASLGGRSSHLAQVALKQTQIEYLVQQLSEARQQCNRLQEEKEEKEKAEAEQSKP